MTARFKQIIDQLNALVTFKNVKAMTDDDFIANIGAVNLLCNLYDDLGLDSKGMRRKMKSLYPELVRRIDSKESIQLAMPLIKALYDFIYGRENDQGLRRWRDALSEMCLNVVESYRKNPLIDSTEYLFALDMVCRIEDDSIIEYKGALASYLEDIDEVSFAERVRRVRAYERARLLFIPENWERWAEVREAVSQENPSGLDDETFMLWREIAEVAPMKELKKRAGNSRRMEVEYLQGCVLTEFAKESRLKDKRKLARDLKTLNDDIIGDIIPVKISADLSVATLYALETIFYLRLQLAQVGWEDSEPIYESLCRNRLEQIAKALTKRYKKTDSLNEKIEILERLSIIGGMIHSHYSDFAIEEATKLLNTPSLEERAGKGLSYSQMLRLDWIPNIKSENESQIVAELLPNIIPSRMEGAAFDMATLALISDFVTPAEREAIFNRFKELLNAAVTTKDIKAIFGLLAIAANWNSDPHLRHLLKDLTEKVRKAISPEGDLSEAGIILHLNPIAAEIFSCIDKITGKYDILSA